MSGGAPAGHRSRLYGRRKGRPLSPTRAALLARRLPELLVDPGRIKDADPRSLFAVPVSAVRLEVGCGAGEHFIHEATAAPDIGFLGVEPFEEGLARMVAGIDAAGLRNVRLHDGDAAELLDALPDASLDRIDLLFPDPWPKRRHWKRRFVSDANLDRFARVLAPGGRFRCASDIPAYIDWTLQHVMKRGDLVWTATRADDWRRPWAGWPGTRYEAKAHRAGRKPAWLVFERR
ncbi:MAG: tRNA (guanosine(46)-N7)-methyltransferase TrmB [Bauldia sp.]|nr:tRNA (guanosine(46)-N7)-methyltransferase TrmB [Bauldia sp.]